MVYISHSKPLLCCSAVLSFALASTVTAQSIPHSRTLPSFAQGAYLGSASSFPFGRDGGRAQYWIRADQVGLPGAIRSIGSRPSNNYTGAARTQSYEVQGALTTLTYSNFTNVFANNLGATSKVLHARKNVSIPATSGSDPDAYAAQIALDTPLVIVPGMNLVLDFDLGSAVGASSAPYNSDLLVLSTSKHVSSDANCGGTLTASSTTNSYDLSLSGAAPQGAALFMLSASHTYWGPIALPFKLDAIGLNGCLLGVDPQINVGLLTNASGGASLSIPFTPPAEAPVIYAQVLHLDATTPTKLATSNVTRSILAGTGFCRYIYNFTQDGTTAQNGPYEWQAALMVK